MLSPQFAVAHDFNLRHDLETGLEAQWFASMSVQIGHSRLRDRRQPEPVGLLAEIAWHQSVNDVVLNFLPKPLPDNRRRSMPAAESWNASQLLISLDQHFGLARDFLVRNL